MQVCLEPGREGRSPLDVCDVHTTEDDASFDEIFTFYNPLNDGTKYREQSHKLNMPSMERMIDIIKSSGFKLKEKIHLVSVGKEYQYLVLFTK